MWNDDALILNEPSGQGVHYPLTGFFSPTMEAQYIPRSRQGNNPYAKEKEGHDALFF